MTDNKQYPPLPDFEEVEQHVYWVSRGYIPRGMLEPIHELMRAYVDADRAMRATKAAPQPAENTWAQLDAMRSELAADIRDVFDANGPETPQIVRDVIEYADSWLQAYIQRKAESPTQPAAPASQDALDQGVREELSIGKAINRAARDLPEGWEIRIDLERHAGVVFLIDPDGNETMSEGGELFSDQINAAIDAPRGAQGESNG